MSRNVVVEFEYPTHRVDGEVIREGEISGVKIEAAVENSPVWDEVAFVGYPDTSVLFEDLASGKWHFRGTVIGIDEEDNSGPTGASIEIPRAAMGELKTFTVRLR